MSTKKIFAELSPEEIVDSYVLPVKLTAKQQKSADRELAEARLKRRKSLTEEELLYSRLFQLRVKLEAYLDSDEYNPTLNFGYFLKEYLDLQNKKKKDFANEVDIHDTLLSQYINNRREPNQSIMIRLELHSGNIIPAINWLKLVEKEKEHVIKNDSSLRKREERHVSKKLQLSF